MRQQRFDQRKTLDWYSTFLVHQLPIARKSSCIQATVPTRKKYRFTSVGNATYRITNVNSGKALDVYGGSTANGAAFQQYDSNGTSAQQWTVRNYSSGKVTLISVNANKAVDIPGGNATQQTKLQMYTPNGTAAQQWTISKVSTQENVWMPQLIHIEGSS